MNGPDEEELLAEPVRVPEPAQAKWLGMQERLKAEAESIVHRRRTARRLRWGLLSAAAAVLMLAVVWKRGTDNAPSTPGPTVTAAAEARRWVPGAPSSHGEPLYLSPDCWVVLSPGSRVAPAPGEGTRLRLEQGGLDWVNYGWTPVSLETSRGVLASAPGEPLEAEIRLEAGNLASGFLLREALADSGPRLSVAVRRGRLDLLRQGKPPIAVEAGRRLILGAGDEARWEEVPKAAPLQTVLRRLDPPASTEGSPGVLPLDLPSGRAYAWTLEFKASAASSSLGIAFPTSEQLRFWHPGADLGAGDAGWHRLRVVVRDGWAEGWLDGRLCIATDHAGRRFQDPPVEQPGLVVWGSVQVRSLESRLLP